MVLDRKDWVLPRLMCFSARRFSDLLATGHTLQPRKWHISLQSAFFVRQKNAFVGSSLLFPPRLGMPTSRKCA